MLNVFTVRTYQCPLFDGFSQVRYIFKTPLTARKLSIKLLKLRYEKVCVEPSQPATTITLSPKWDKNTD